MCLIVHGELAVLCHQPCVVACSPQCIGVMIFDLLYLNCTVLFLQPFLEVDISLHIYTYMVSDFFVGCPLPPQHLSVVLKKKEKVLLMLLLLKLFLLSRNEGLTSLCVVNVKLTVRLPQQNFINIQKIKYETMRVFCEQRKLSMDQLLITMGQKEIRGGGVGWMHYFLGWIIQQKKNLYDLN